MDAIEFRNQMIYLALQGKLTSQNPNDEPASVLLDKIKEEKEQLIKDKKIKRNSKESVIFRKNNHFYEKIGKKEPVCIDEDLSFKVPKSWELCRLGSICQLLNAPKYENEELNYLEVKYLRGTKEPDIKNKGKIVEKGSTVILVDGENSGEIFKIPERGYLGSTFRILNIPSSVDEKYFLNLIGFYKQLLKENKKGAAIPHLNKEIFNNILIGLPPLNEQKRIVNILNLVDKYVKADTKFNELNDKFSFELKELVLQRAIKGELVEQNPDDEPASVLLDKIREEKEQLIKDKKIKRNKNESFIYRENNHFYETFIKTKETICIDDEIEYNIPENWELVRLDNIGVYKKGPFGSSLTKSMFVPKSEDSVKVYEQKNAIQKNHKLGEYYITKEYYEQKMKGFAVESGDIIVSCAGTIGETYLMPEDIELGIINQALMRMNIVPSINLDYFLIYFDYILKKSAIEQSKGSAIKNIPPFKVFKKLLFPLPPFEEQERIVCKIKEFYNKINKLI